MAGEAKTTAFNIGTATVMIGPMEDVEKLNPKEHSIGLVKNFTTSSTDQYTDLTQGIQNDIVWSEKTGSDTTTSMEVYEYTAKNLAYGLGQSATKMVESKAHTLKSVSATEVVVDAEGASSDDYLDGDRIIIQSADSEDMVFVGKIVTASYSAGSSPEIALSSTVVQWFKKMNALMAGAGVLTIEEGKLKLIAADDATVAFSQPIKTAFGFEDGTGSITGTVAITAQKKLSAMGIADNDSLAITINSVESELIAKTTPSEDTSAKFTLELASAPSEVMQFKEGDKVKRVNLIYVGSRAAQPFLGAKVVGILPDGKTPITIIYPKIRITNGFNVGFQSDNYSNLPFEFTPFRMVEGDPSYEEHGDGLFYLLK